MRRDHHPFWVQKALGELNRLWAQRFLVPQFESIGKEPRFQGPSFIDVKGYSIRAGDHLHAFATKHQPMSMSVAPYDGGDGRIDIGDYCVLSPGVRIRSAISITIGNNCMIAECAYITDADWHDLYHRIYPGKRAPVLLGNNVWVGDSATICKGVTVGDNAVIGARSVVTKDVPANCVAAGNPARVVKELDPTRDFSMREHLFTRPYDEFKDEYDQQRLAGNTTLGWLRHMLRPGPNS